jgi:hypothetical protein
MASPGGGIEVDPAALARHADAVAGVATAVARGQDAARQVRLGSDAYGKLCQALPAMLEPIHDLADRLLSDVHDALLDTSDSVRSASRHYGRADGEAVGRFRTDR